MIYVVYIADRGYENNHMTWIIDTELTPGELKQVIHHELDRDEYDDHFVQSIKPLDEVVRKY